MKKILGSFLLILLALTLCFPLSAKKVTDAKEVSELLQAACPTEFGYVDNSEYYMSSYFSSLEDVDDFHIVTCADSTNFSEIGVFHLKNSTHLSQNQKLLKKYLAKIKANFENGVVYNTKEYPKFENAAVITVDDFVIYMILTPDQSAKATQLLQNLLG